MLPSANADAPTSLSSLLLLGLHRIGEALMKVGRRVDLPRGTHGLERGETASVTPSEPEAVSAAASPAFDKALQECPSTYPWKKLPNGLAERSDPEPSAQPAIEARRERRGTEAECPIA